MGDGEPRVREGFLEEGTLQLGLGRPNGGGNEREQWVCWQRWGKEFSRKNPEAAGWALGDALWSGSISGHGTFPLGSHCPSPGEGTVWSASGTGAGERARPDPQIPL